MGATTSMVNGVVIAFLGVPAVVMTLAMDGIMEGLTLGLSSGMTCQACASYAPPVVQEAVHERFPASTTVILWVAVIAFVSFILSFTTFGRRTYAIGNNPLASYLAGVNVRLVTTLLYVLSGFFAALAGVLLVGFGGQASLGMGTPYLFPVDRGCRDRRRLYMLGGRGHYLGAAAGAVTWLRSVGGRTAPPGYEHARLRA